MEKEKEKSFFEELEDAYTGRTKAFVSAFLALFTFVLFSIATAGAKQIPFTHYFLSVGQGDSQAVMFHSGAVALIDGGPPNGRALRELEKILPFYKRSVDIVFLTHPEEDHFGGLIELFKHFDVDALVTNGDKNDTEAYYEFTKTLEQKNIKTIALSAGDKVRQGDITFSVLWPSERSDSGEYNENSLVLLAESGGKKALYMGDIPKDIEEKIAETNPSLADHPVPEGFNADIMKVGHHGSKTSTGEALLFKTHPAAAFIEVGENNYGHPAPEVLSRLANIGAQVFRTDRDGTLGARFIGDTLQIFRLK